jgi:hypothetical protein
MRMPPHGLSPTRPDSKRAEMVIEHQLWSFTQPWRSERTNHVPILNAIQIPHNNLAVIRESSDVHAESRLTDPQFNRSER